MKQWIFNCALIAGLLFTSACGTDKAEGEKTQVAGSKKLSNEESLDAEIKAIDDEAAKAGLVANSLTYGKENGESIEVLAHLNEKNVILKLEEKFSEGMGKDNGTITYYMKNGIPFATKEYFEDNANPQTPKFVERISYYDAKGKVLATKEKRVDFEEELVNVGFVSVPTHSCSVARAMRVLDQKGEFETTFQGFALTEALNYLIVGQPGDDGYSTALRIEHEDAFIQEAMRDQKKMLNQKCRVSFQLAQTSGFTYQVYTGGQWVD